MIHLLFLSTQENGQRKYGGPPPGWDGPPPERGCEIFIGKLPRDLFEDELIPLCEKVMLLNVAGFSSLACILGMGLVARNLTKT